MRERPGDADKGGGGGVWRWNRAAAELAQPSRAVLRLDRCEEDGAEAG